MGFVNWLKRRLAPKPRYRKVFDVSNWWHYPHLPTWDEAVSMMQGAKDAGYEGVIIGVYHNELEVAQLQARAAAAVGLWVDLYVLLYHDDDDFMRIEACIQVPGANLTWLDFETEVPITLPMVERRVSQYRLSRRPNAEE